MAEEEHTKKINESKIKKRTYTGYDDDEFVAGNEGMKRAVLAKYDEDIEGTRESVSLFEPLLSTCFNLQCIRDFVLEAQRLRVTSLGSRRMTKRRRP